MSKITNKTKDPYENFFRVIFDGSNRRVVIHDSEHFQHPEDFKDSVDYVLDGLTDREMTVIKMRFGFDGYEPSTWAKIADVLNCSIQRAQQIQRKVIYNITQSNKGIIIRDGLKRYNYELDKEVNELNPDCFISDNVKEYVETNPNTSFSKAIMKSQDIPLLYLDLSKNTITSCYRLNIQTLYDLILKPEEEIRERVVYKRQINELIDIVNQFFRRYDNLDRRSFLYRYTKLKNKKDNKIFKKDMLDKLNNTLEIFKDITSCAEDIIDELNKKKGNTIKQVCIEHNIDYTKLIKLIDSKTLMNIYKTKAELNYTTIDIIDPYEDLFRAIFRLKETDVVVHPADFKESVNYAISTLNNERQEKVIKMRFGIEDYKLTLDELAKMFNVSNTVIYFVEQKALERLRYYGRAEIIRDGLIATKVNKYKEAQLIKIAEKTAKKHIEECRKMFKGKEFESVEIENPIDRFIADSKYIYINDLELSNRARNALGRRFSTLSGLLKSTNLDLLEIRGFGKGMIREVDDYINSILLGYGIDMDRYEFSKFYREMEK